MSNREVTVRPADENDVEWMLGALRAFAAAYGTKLSLFPRSIDQARETLRAMMAGGAFFVAFNYAGVRVGFAGGLLVQHPFNPDVTMLSELFWYVSPQHRTRTRAGAALLDAFTEFGRANADLVSFCHVVGRTGVREGNMTRRGYRAYEQTFMLETNRRESATALEVA